MRNRTAERAMGALDGAEELLRSAASRLRETAVELAKREGNDRYVKMAEECEGLADQAYRLFIEADDRAEDVSTEF